ncbi:MAG: Ig-like domain repeat protein [Rhodanobacteraceae bacterium]|nr:Ig-like domain repeat protein [Rhodanobacteraceae bacterium]
MSSISNADVTSLNGTGTINDDDVAQITINDVGLTEGDSGSQNLQFTVSRSGNGGAFSVDYATSNATATAGSDYTSTTGTLNFTANGAPSQVINVPITGESLVEVTETFTVTLSNVVNTLGTAAISDGSGTGTITDNDSATVQFAPTSVSRSEGSSPMAFTVTLTNPVQSGVTLAVNSTNGSAGAADYTAISGGSVSFPANSSASQTVNVTLNNDALDEDDETFTLTLSGLTATGNVTLGTALATGTILDDDATPTLSITSPSQNEGNAGPSTMNFVVSLSAVSGRTVSFNRATADGTATVANNDYVAIATGSLSIPAGQTSVTRPVTITGDPTFEGNETFSVNLSGITNATPGTLTGTGTIVEDDQQPTTTTITSDLPDPSVVGQPYTVSVTVTAQTTSPAGTVTISDGSASCGPVTLTAATAPNATASCSLTSTTAGAKTLTASYTAATTAFGNSSGTTAHQVNPAGTSISVTGPTRSRINQPTAFTFALSVNAPGAGTPTGTVTLSSGASSCTATLPATSCNLSFTTLGSRTVSASYAGDGNFSASSSSGAGNAQTLVYAQSDIAVSKSDAISVFRPGELIVYTVQVRNLGPDAAQGIRVRDDIPAGIANTVWSCDASGGVTCPVTGGSGNLDTTTAAFPVGGLLTFTFYGTAQNVQQILNQALVELPADTTVEDLVPGNNTASDLDRNEFIFADGLEDPLVVTAAGSFRVPGLALRAVVGEVATAAYRLNDTRGEALRLYARQFDGQMQYALAQLGADGTWQLGQWQALEGEPLLSWTVIASDTGYRLQGASLH